MTALAAERIPCTVRNTNKARSFPVAASVTIYKGSIVSMDSSGYARPGRVSLSDKCIGVADETVTNGTTAGAVSVNVSKPIAWFGNSGSIAQASHVGQACFVLDDQTVSLTDNANTRCRAGRIHDVDTTLGVAVDFDAQPVLVVVSGRLTDISTASTLYLPCPVNGRVVKVMATIENAITVADSVCTSSISGAAITGGGFTAAYTASAAGTTFTGTPTAANYVNAGQYLSFVTDGASTTACVANVSFLVAVG